MYNTMNDLSLPSYGKVKAVGPLHLSEARLSMNKIELFIFSPFREHLPKNCNQIIMVTIESEI